MGTLPYRLTAADYNFKALKQSTFRVLALFLFDLMQYYF